MLDDRHAQPPAMLTVIKSWFKLAQFSCRSSHAVIFCDPYDKGTFDTRPGAVEIHFCEFLIRRSGVGIPLGVPSMCELLKTRSVRSTTSPRVTFFAELLSRSEHEYEGEHDVPYTDLLPFIVPWLVGDCRLACTGIACGG